MANLDAVSRTLQRMEGRQVDRAGECVISAPGEGEGTIDAEGVYTPPAASERWSGACWVRPSTRATSTRNVDVAGQQVTLHLYDVKVPWDATAEKDDVVTVTTSRDPLLEGRQMIVREVVVREYGASRTLVCQESR